MPLPFQSILFDKPEPKAETAQSDPALRDLNLDQIFDMLLKGREEYDLLSFFLTPLHDVGDISYRHGILRDLEREALREHIKSFAQDMQFMREHLSLALKFSYEYEKARWFLDAVEIYCEALSCLADELQRLDLKSRGFQALRDYLESYVASEVFRSLLAETKKVKEGLSGLTYDVRIRDKRITVAKYEGEPDYSVEVEETFRKFQQGAVKDYRVVLPEQANMNHIEAGILDRVARLYPNAFRDLIEYFERHRDYLDPTIRRFDREVQFYLAYLDFIEKMRIVGLNFCYPTVTDGSKEVLAHETFDLALASKLIREHSNVVCNDFHLKNHERIIVVSGPNQGGKTTFARTFGQLHYLARLGYPVPGKEARLFLCDRLFTQFEREEHIENLRGKLQDDLVRIHEVLQQATSNSILIMNESFVSTTLSDALFLSQQILGQVIERDVLCVYVTFMDELSTLSEKTVSMVSTVVPENPTLRTFKIVRKPADGRAYAIAIAEKYGLTYESLKKRITR
jgi:DNA mismatch repair protein MutS